jgi:hypothetical protein
MRAITCLALCLLLSACGTPAPKQLTLAHIETPQAVCPELVLCRLPGRPALVVNEDWDRALTQTEAALLQCAAQVDDCMQRQKAIDHATPR